MADYDLRLDLPARAFINSQLVSLLEKGGTAWDAKRHLFETEHYKNSGLDPYTYALWDHSTAISLLFCCIVVPREFLDLPQNHEIYQGFDQQNIPRLFDFLDPPGVDSYMLIRCLRNSVAHALFSVAERTNEWGYEFWTERQPIFRGRIGHRKLIDFVSSVAVPLVTAVLSRKKDNSSS